MKRALLILLAAGLSAGCGTDSDDTIDFPTGEFVIHTVVVDDQCLDGGLNLLFMPNGTETPWEWPHPVAFHSEDTLPKTYTIQLRDPFGEMTVTATDAGPDQQQIVAETNEGVLLGEAQFGQCVVNMDATVDVRIESADRASGTAALKLSDPRGDDACPVNMPTRCEVFLSFEAERQ